LDSSGFGAVDDSGKNLEPSILLLRDNDGGMIVAVSKAYRSSRSNTSQSMAGTVLGSRATIKAGVGVRPCFSVDATKAETIPSFCSNVKRKARNKSGTINKAPVSLLSLSRCATTTMVGKAGVRSIRTKASLFVFRYGTMLFFVRKRLLRFSIDVRYQRRLCAVATTAHGE
jgi:hypothetical protein